MRCPSLSSEPGKKGKFLLPLPFAPCRPRMDCEMPTTHPHWGGPSTLLSPLTYNVNHHTGGEVGISLGTLCRILFLDWWIGESGTV